MLAVITIGYGLLDQAPASHSDDWIHTNTPKQEFYDEKDHGRDDSPIYTYCLFSM
jgi:hypothetical protein